MVVWLRATPRTSHGVSSSTESSGRCWVMTRWGAGPAGAERTALYAQVADLEVDVGGATPERLADEIARLLS